MTSLCRPLFSRSGDQPWPLSSRGDLGASEGVGATSAASRPCPAAFRHHHSVPRFLLLPLPANHFSAGNNPTQNCFQTFWEHGEIGKQNKPGTRVYSFCGMGCQDPGDPVGLSPGPGCFSRRGTGLSTPGGWRPCLIRPLLPESSSPVSVS